MSKYILISKDATIQGFELHTELNKVAKTEDCLFYSAQYGKIKIDVDLVIGKIFINGKLSYTDSDKVVRRVFIKHRYREDRRLVDMELVGDKMLPLVGWIRDIDSVCIFCILDLENNIIKIVKETHVESKQEASSP